MNISNPKNDSTKLVIRVVAALIQDGQARVLITQRRPQAFMALKWEFPGGKVEPGESDEQALMREIQEELNVSIQVLEHFAGIVYSYPDFSVDFHVYRCSILDGELKKIAVNDFKWVSISDLDSFDFPPADQPTIEKLVRDKTT